MLNFCLDEIFTKENMLQYLGDRITDLGNDKWFIPKFVAFQYGKLDSLSKPHLSVIKELKKEGLAKGLVNPYLTLKDKDKVKDKDKDKDKDIYNIYIEAWNKLFKNKVSHLTNKRKQHLTTRLKEPSFINGYAEILRKAHASDFLMGRQPSQSHPNFRVTFDWIIKNEENYVKILEGKYDGKKKRSDR